MTQDPWNPRQYECFAAERSRPFHDLVALVQPVPRMRVIDLGCGTGELTAKLHAELRAIETLGIDTSDAMLERCRAQRASGLHFEKTDIAALALLWRTKPPKPPFDLVLSNAAIHWVNDHETVLAGLSRGLGPRGQLAVQVPANDDHTSHVVARELAREAPFAEALKGWAGRDPVAQPERYATWLDRLGFAEQRVRLEVYAHRLESRDGVLEWVKGTLLTDYERRLGLLFPAFLTRYAERLRAALPDDRPFFYPFKRILFWGRQP